MGQIGAQMDQIRWQIDQLSVQMSPFIFLPLSFPSPSYLFQVTISDPEIGLPNLVEAKHHALARPFRDTPTDRDLKPNAAVRDQLNTISGSVTSFLFSS